MSHAFPALDDYFWSVCRDSDTSGPDGALDWIYMMHDDDWALLRAAWPARPPGWREECAYVLGQGPFEQCLPFLAEAIFDPDYSVAIEAANSFSALLLERESTPQLSLAAWLRLNVIFETAKGLNVTEVRELLRRSTFSDPPQTNSPGPQGQP